MLLFPLNLDCFLRDGPPQYQAVHFNGETSNASLADLLRQLNWTLRGWCNYFRHAVASGTFSYLDHYTWHRVARWLLKRHKGLTWKKLHRRYLTSGPWRRFTEDGITLFSPQETAITCYRWRATRIPTPWANILVASTTV